jgi:undecaprenyl-diphosphatase
MWALSYSGLSQVQALFALLLLRWQNTKALVMPLLVTILVAGIPVAQGLKRLLPRDRPSNLFFAQPQEQWLANSFPSGHTTTAFAFATMLFLTTRGTQKQWIGWLAIVWAILVGISRIYRGVHWPSDALGGACAGIFSACAVYLILRKMGKELHNPQFFARDV